MYVCAVAIIDADPPAPHRCLLLKNIFCNKFSTPALPLPVGGPPSADPNAYVLQDLDSVDDILPGQAIGGSGRASAEQAATGESGSG